MMSPVTGAEKGCCAEDCGAEGWPPPYGPWGCGAGREPPGGPPDGPGPADVCGRDGIGGRSLCSVAMGGVPPAVMPGLDGVGMISCATGCSAGEPENASPIRGPEGSVGGSCNGGLHSGERCSGPGWTELATRRG